MVELSPREREILTFERECQRAARQRRRQASRLGVT